MTRRVLVGDNVLTVVDATSDDEKSNPPNLLLAMEGFEVREATWGKRRSSGRTRYIAGSNPWASWCCTQFPNEKDQDRVAVLEPSNNLRPPTGSSTGSTGGSTESPIASASNLWVGVFDGHGGVHASDYCKTHLLQELPPGLAIPSEADVAAGFSSANEHVCAASKRGGTTATCLFLAEDPSSGAVEGRVVRRRAG